MALPTKDLNLVSGQVEFRKDCSVKQKTRGVVISGLLPISGHAQFGF